MDAVSGIVGCATPILIFPIFNNTPSSFADIEAISTGFTTSSFGFSSSIAPNAVKSSGRTSCSSAGGRKAGIIVSGRIR